MNIPKKMNPMMPMSTTDAHDANDANLNKQSKEIKDSNTCLKPCWKHCLKDHNPINKNEIRVVKDQKVYLIRIQNGLAYVSDGRFNGWVPQDVIEPPCEATLEPNEIQFTLPVEVPSENEFEFTQPVEFSSDLLPSVSYQHLTELKTSSKNDHLLDDLKAAESAAESTIQDTDYLLVHHEPTNSHETETAKNDDLETSLDSLNLGEQPEFAKSAKKVGRTLTGAIAQITGESSKKRKNDDTKELSSERIHRLPESQRSSGNASFVVVTNINNIFYRYHFSSANKKGLIRVSCYDCKSKLTLQVDDSVITSFVSGKKKRFGINPEANLTVNDIEIMSSTTIHQCTGRPEEDTKENEEYLVKIISRIVNNIEHPDRACPEDIFEDVVSDFVASFSRKTIREMFAKQGPTFKRNLYDKIHARLQKRRQEKGVQGKLFDPEEYTTGIFQLYRKAFDEEEMYLFLDMEELSLLRNASNILLLDATFPKIPGFYQLLKCRIISKSSNCLVFYCFMRTKTLSEYTKVFSYVSEVLFSEFGENKILCHTFCTDEEASFERIHDMFVISANRGLCSFHVINKWLKKFHDSGLKTFISRSGVESDNKDIKIISENWKILKILVYLPYKISLPMVEYCAHRVSKCTETVKTDFLHALEYIKHDVETKSHKINWFTLMKTTKTYLDTTTSKLERSNASLKKFISRNSRNKNASERIRLVNRWAIKESLKTDFFQNTASRRTKAVKQRRKEMKRVGRALEKISSDELTYNSKRRECFKQILEISKKF